MTEIVNYKLVFRGGLELTAQGPRNATAWYLYWVNGYYRQYGMDLFQDLIYFVLVD